MNEKTDASAIAVSEKLSEASMQTTIPSARVVLGYPYDGSIWHMFGSIGGAAAREGWRSHPYYSALYGADPKIALPATVNISTFYDEIILPPADEYTPKGDTETEAGRHYADIGLTIGKWDDYSRFAYEAAERIVGEPSIADALKLLELPSLDRHVAVSLVQRTMQQLQIALAGGASFMCDKAGERLANAIWHVAGADIGATSRVDAGPKRVIIGQEVWPLIGFDWNCQGYDDFVAVRSSPKIRAYGSQFREAVNSCSRDNLASELKLLMNRARAEREIAEQARGAFATAGVVSNLIGLIPAVQTVMSFVGMGNYLAEKNRERAVERQSWFQLGTEVKRVAFDEMLKRDEVKDGK